MNLKNKLIIFKVKSGSLKVNNVKLKLMAGHFYIRWKPAHDIPYHCDLITLYEIFIRSSNGFKCRTYRLHYSDGDVWSVIEKDHVSDSFLQDILDEVKELTEDEFNKIYNNVVLNPDRAEEWFKNNKPESVVW